jgi:hypothetical protein
VNSDPHVEPQWRGIVADRQPAVHSTGGPIEEGEEAVAGYVNLAPAKAGQQRPNALLVRRDEITPRAVAHPRRGLAGAMLLFFFNVPRYPTKEQAGKSALLIEEDGLDEERRFQWADRTSKAGAVLLAIGFAFQFAGLVCGT